MNAIFDSLIFAKRTTLPVLAGARSVEGAKYSQKKMRSCCPQNEEVAFLAAPLHVVRFGIYIYPVLTCASLHRAEMEREGTT